MAGSANLRLYVSMLFMLALLVFFANLSIRHTDKYKVPDDSKKKTSTPSVPSMPTTKAPVYAADLFQTPTPSPSSSPSSSSSSPSSPSSPSPSSPSSPPLGVDNPTDRLLEQYAVAERRLQDKYGLRYGKYEYEPIPNVYPLNGLGVNYDQSYPSTLPTGCNLMVVQPDLKFPFTNLLQ